MVRKSISADVRLTPKFLSPEPDGVESFPITNAKAATENIAITRAKVDRILLDEGEVMARSLRRDEESFEESEERDGEEQKSKEFLH